jgi:hypothetical protein
MQNRKSLMNWKGVLIGLATLVFSIGLFRYTLADIVFPNTFTSGTTASASQVNANFAAINTRQSATAALMAGTWFYNESGYEISSTYGVCPEIGTGSITLNANGTASITEIAAVANCNDSTVPPTVRPYPETNIITAGTFTVSSTGVGTITLSDGSTYGFTTSKDLNTMQLFGTNIGTAEFSGGEKMVGTALRL